MVFMVINVHDVCTPCGVCLFDVKKEIEVRPGIVSKDESGRLKCTPIFSRVISLYAEQNDLQYAVPGGLIGVSNISRQQYLPLSAIFNVTINIKK